MSSDVNSMRKIQRKETFVRYTTWGNLLLYETMKKINALNSELPVFSSSSTDLYVILSK